MSKKGQSSQENVAKIKIYLTPVLLNLDREHVLKIDGKNSSLSIDHLKPTIGTLKNT